MKRIVVIMAMILAATCQVSKAAGCERILSYETGRTIIQAQCDILTQAQLESIKIFAENSVPEINMFDTFAGEEDGIFTIQISLLESNGMSGYYIAHGKGRGLTLKKAFMRAIISLLESFAQWNIQAAGNKPAVFLFKTYEYCVKL